MESLKWSAKEKKIARRAFDFAYEQECSIILKHAKEQMFEMCDSKGIWKIEEYLRGMRIYVDRKYDYRYSMLTVLFARMINEGIFPKEKLEGLAKEKIENIDHYVAEGVGV